MEPAPAHSGPLTALLEDDHAAWRRQRMGRLCVLSGPQRGRVFAIDKPRCSAGRSIINDIVLDDPEVAGTHFDIIASPDGYRVRALDAGHGIHIGELRICEAYLQDRTEFRAGATRLRFELLEQVVDVALSGDDRFHGIVGRSPAMREIFAQLEKIAPSTLTCMLTGETGVGKERLARAIHKASERRDGPFVVLDCGSLPRELIESTLFGHEKGSFTGAIGQHRGCFEQARGGTIFLDEIGELDISLQPKLLRVIEQREIQRIGGARTIDIDVRVIAATHRDLRAAIDAGTFRDDLYYRLSVVRIEIPPLRERAADIPIIARQFLAAASDRRGVDLRFDKDAIDALVAYHWPGNVRELRNVVERAAALSDMPTIGRAELAFGQHRGSPADADATSTTQLDQAFKDAKREVLQSFEVRYLRALMARHKGNISQAARAAGLTRYHLRELLKRHDLVS